MEKFKLSTIVHTSSSTTVQKAIIKETDEEVLLKFPASEYPSFTTIESFKKDYQFSKLLHENYPKNFIRMMDMIEQKNGSVFLVEESGFTGLQFYIQQNMKMDLEKFLNIAIGMVECLKFVHSKNIIHRDIKLANFVITNNNEKQEVKLIDFGLSVMVSRKSPSVPCTSPTGTFNYMSPEQTGRISKNVDFRSDIYSLGISFYQLFTGELPFTGDLLALVHSHITKKLPLIEGIPQVLNDLLQKMCSKNPADRYNSAEGIQKDLEFILTNINSIPKDFQIGTRDSKIFQISNKLYGREEELKLLQEAIEFSNEKNFCLISGSSGMGKSKLIDELLKYQELKLLMAYGKFDQFNRMTPYSAFISVMQSLINSIDSNSKIKDQVSMNIKKQLGDELIAVLYSILPEISLFVEPKKSPEALSTVNESKDRLYQSFIKYFNCFINENILVIVIDDLQWIDSASFEFLEKLLNLKQYGIFIIGAYRDNEISDSHPLMSIINDDKTVRNIKLEALKLKHLNEMVSDTLEIHPEKTMELSSLIHQKTLGNPFFSKEFINTLYQENLISIQNESWFWNLENVKTMNFSSNVIDFMIKNLKKKKTTTQKLLNRASCIGNTFKIEELKWIWDEDLSSSIEQQLMEPMNEGWIFQINSNQYKFYHDKLQQTAYELYEKFEAQKIHLTIGSKLLENYKKQNSVEENIFTIVHHLNISKSNFSDQKELINLNIIAAKKSLQNSAFDAALILSEVAIELLPQDSWETDYQLALEVYSIYAEALYSNSKLEESEKQFDILLEKAQGTVDRLIVYGNYLRNLSIANKFDAAYELFVSTFQLFDFTKSIPLDSVDETYEWILNLKSKIDEELIKIGSTKNILKLKKCEDVEITQFLHTLFRSVDVAFFCDSANPFTMVAMSLISLYVYLTKGLDDNAPFGLSLAGWIYSFFFKDTTCYDLSSCAEKLFINDKNPTYNVPGVRFFLGLGSLIGANRKQIIDHLDSGANYAMNHGEYLFGAYCCQDSSNVACLNGDNMFNLLKKMKKYHKWINEKKNDFMSDHLELMKELIKDLAGISTFNPKFKLPNFRKMKCSGSYVPTYEGILHYLKGEYNHAMKKFVETEPYCDQQLGLCDYYELKFYRCITMTRLSKETKDLEKYKVNIEEVLEEIKSFADLSPEYLSPKYNLMNAYYKSIQENSNSLKIANELEAIYSSAMKFGLLILAAVTSEILVEFGDDNEFPTSFCQHHYHQTLKIWSGMGAKAKVDQLKKKYSRYMISELRNSPNYHDSITSSIAPSTDDTTTLGNDSFDMMSILKVTQAISVELSISSLISKVMSIVIENTGAERGCLFLQGSNGEFLESSISNGNITTIHKLTSEIQENQLFCSHLFSVAKSMKKTVIVSNTSTSEYAKNKYILREGIKAICVHPIYKGHKYIGAIYLENKALDGIFDEKRKEILEHISSQLAISYENAKLYEDMNSLNLSYERFLPKEFLNQIGKGDVRNIQIGDASTKKICVLFSDIRSFTTLTEKMNPKESFSFVNQILSYLAPIITKNNGFIDKFLGDCIMALFPHDVDDSIKCGYEMQSAMKLYNIECRNGLKPVSIGIGIHYGDVMLGTVGTEERIDATVISDAVNTASRVESLTKTLGSKFVVTNEVLQNSKYHYLNRYIGTFLLQGKEIPVKLFHILSENDIPKKDIDVFQKGMDAFESKKFKESHQLFSLLNDKTSKYLVNVSKRYQYYSFDNSWKGEILIDKDGNLIELYNIDLVDDKRIDDLTEEDEKNLLESLRKGGKLKDYLKQWSKRTPEIVHTMLDNFK